MGGLVVWWMMEDGWRGSTSLCMSSVLRIRTFTMQEAKGEEQQQQPKKNSNYYLRGTERPKIAMVDLRCYLLTWRKGEDGYCGVL